MITDEDYGISVFWGGILGCIWDIRPFFFAFFLFLAKCGMFYWRYCLYSCTGMYLIR